jgi:hypothetical protein
VKLTPETAQLYRCIESGAMMKVDTVPEANGVRFDCPLGHGHSVLVFFAAHPGTAPLAPPDMRPTPRWAVSGRTLADLTLSPSVNLDVPHEGCAECGEPRSPCPLHPGAGRKSEPPGCRWHGWVKNGEAL